MRTAIVLGRRHGAAASELLVKPEDGVQAAKDKFKEFLGFSGVHPDFERVEIWDQDQGCERVLRLHSPELAKVAQEQAVKDQAAFDAAQKPTPKAKGKPAKAATYPGKDAAAPAPTAAAPGDNSDWK